MTNGTAPARKRTRGPAMTIRVYTVTREGVVTAPRATVSVPRSHTPPAARASDRRAHEHAAPAVRLPAAPSGG